MLMLGRLPATLTELFLGYAALGSAGAISLSGPSRAALERPRRHGENRLYMVLLHGCDGRLATLFGGFLFGPGSASAMSAGNLAELRTLFLRENNIDAAGAAKLAGAARLVNCRHLRSLDLSANSIGDAGAKAFADVLPYTALHELNRPGPPGGMYAPLAFTVES